jgi:RND family efflux transporter MFP subunit
MNKKNVLIASIVIVVIAALGFAVSRQIASRNTVTEASATETTIVERGDLSLTIDASGSLIPHADVSLAFTVGGRVADVLIVEGRKVDAGQSLLRLDTQDLEWQVEQARLSLTLAELDLSEARDWYAEADEPVQIALAKLEQAQVSVQQAEWRLAQATLMAPISGIVTALDVDAAETANSGQTVVVLSDLSTLDIVVNVDETNVVGIQSGMKVIVSVDAFPTVELSGHVTEIASLNDVQSGVVLYPVTVRLASTDLPLRPGMTVNVTFPIQEKKDTIIVPFRAVETEGGQAYVTRVTGSGSERVAVTLGLITDTQVEILSGLSEGDVVTVYANPVQDTSVMSSPMFGGGN